ncbi:MAG: iron-sulfur cluster biosynthesis family protein [Rhodocyclaceae bacterium]|nr:iron-sulfur cluster biosynthesis family protein [Rhodocyclaceae bacterium]
MFTVTPTAASQILQAAESADESGNNPVMLRVAVKVEDGQLVYGMGFDEAREDDHIIQSENVTVLISPHSRELLSGTTLDFVELAPGEFQFVFNNPNEIPSSCGSSSGGGGCGGCGKSCG